MRLITRSRSMLGLVQSKECDYWKETGGFPLRNIRLFALLSSPRSDETNTSTDAMKRLEEAVKSIELFLTSYDNLRDAVPGQQALSSLQDQMEKIKGIWHEGSQL